MTEKFNIMEYKNQVEQFIQEFIETLESDEQVIDMIKYVLLNDSKKLRAIFILLFSEMFEIEDASVKNYCIAVETMHSYTLIHDDLPAIDNDNMRRGKPSAHIQYSEADALLIGDGLQTLAFETISVKNSYFSTDAVLSAINKFSHSLGLLKGVVYGQFLDIKNKNFHSANLNLEQILSVHRHKTAIFFAFCCELPAVLMNEEQKIIDDCRNFGLKFGMLFQFLDDILDFPSRIEACNICNVLGYTDAKNKYRQDLQEFLRTNKFSKFNYVIETILTLN